MTSVRMDDEEGEEAIELTRSLIRIPSSMKDGNDVYKFMHGYLKKRGLRPEFQKITNPYNTYETFSNLYVKLGNGKGPRIMLNGHLDTVGTTQRWYHHPYGAEMEGGRIFGLGGADMKGGCAAAAVTTIALASRKKVLNGELLLSFVYGEEAPYSLGADPLLREHDLKGYDLIIVTEPSPLLAINDHCFTHRKIHKSRFPVSIIGAEGRVMYEVEFFGKPSQGINALHSRAKLISGLDDYDTYSSIKMGRGHYVVLNIQGGDESFTVPSYCKLLINRQLTIGETEKGTTMELKRIIKNLKLRSKVHVKKRPSPDPEVEYMPYIFEKSEHIDMFMDILPMPKRGKRCRFTTSSVGDFNLFATRSGAPTLVFGPGGGNIHSPDEYVNADEVVATADHLLEYLMGVF